MSTPIKVLWTALLVLALAGAYGAAILGQSFLTYHAHWPQPARLIAGGLTGLGVYLLSLALIKPVVQKIWK